MDLIRFPNETAHVSTVPTRFVMKLVRHFVTFCQHFLGFLIKCLLFIWNQITIYVFQDMFWPCTESDKWSFNLSLYHLSQSFGITRISFKLPIMLLTFNTIRSIFKMRSKFKGKFYIYENNKQKLHNSS